MGTIPKLQEFPDWQERQDEVVGGIRREFDREGKEEAEGNIESVVFAFVF